MSYKAKTDWQYDDVVTENDMNRIEGGIQENKQGLAAHLADYTQFKTSTESDLTSINNNIASLVKIKNNITILATGWVDDTANSGYFIYEITDTDVTSDTVIDVNIHLVDLDKASEIKPVTVSSNGQVTLYADEAPTEDIMCDMKLVRQVV